MKKLKLKIEGMRCSSCAMNIDFCLEDLGVKSARTSYAKQETEIEFNEGRITQQVIIEEIKKNGYKASL